MFAVGQMVFHKSGSHHGKVVETDGDTIYLVQENGVEIEFPSRELTAVSPNEDDPDPGETAFRSATANPPVRRSATAQTGNAPVIVRSRVLTMSDITDEHRKVLAIIPKRTMESVAALHDRQPRAGRFNALDVAQKLNFIAEVTEVPYRIMKEYSDRPGTLGLMMGRGLSVRLRPGG